MKDQPVLFFDGICGLCNGAVDFVMRFDRKKRFLFSPLQSDYAKSKLPAEYTQDMTSLVLMTEGRLWTKSSAVLQIFKHLGGAWKVLFILAVLPVFLRDSIYDFIAQNRYSWFGKKETCRLPTPEERSRFLLDL